MTDNDLIIKHVYTIIVKLVESIYVGQFLVLCLYITECSAVYFSISNHGWSHLRLKAFYIYTYLYGNKTYIPLLKTFYVNFQCQKKVLKVLTKLLLIIDETFISVDCCTICCRFVKVSTNMPESSHFLYTI